MKTWIAALLIALVPAACGGGSSAPPATTASAGGSIGAGLTGPAGMAAAVYATGLAHVAAFAFDDQGRLWTSTADYNDTGGDAVYLVPAAGAAPVKVISGLHTPLGLAWYQGSLYVAANGGVLAYSGFDGANFAQQRTVVKLAPGVGEVNGIVLGPDGRFRLGVSAPCDHCVPTDPDSAAVLSFLPDGSALQVEAKSIRAPIGLAYFPGTSDLFVTMNQRDDLGDATPGDWLSVVSAGQDWRFPDCYGQATSECAAAPKPVASLDKHAAVSGIGLFARDSSNGAAWVAEWATGKLLRVDVTRAATGWTGSVAASITGMQSPVAVAAGPGGELFAGDWGSGTVYRITTS